jgi:flagellar protein FliO/FliZ
LSLGAILGKARAGHQRWLIAVGAVVLAALAFAGSEVGGAALRSGLILLALGAVAAALHRPASGGAAPRPLVVEDRQPLTRESGVAILGAGGRRLLLGYGPAGVSILAEMERRP